MKWFLEQLAKVLNALPKTDWKPIPLCSVYGRYGLEAPNLVGHVNAPTVSTGTASSIADTSFTMGGNITNTGGANATVRGFCYVTGAGGTPTTANSVVNESGSYGTGSYSLGLSGLSSGTTYSVRAYATNSTGTGYGATVEVTTTSPASAPTVTTQAVTSVTATTATGNGNVTSDGGASITERGVCWNTTGTPTTADSKATSAGTTGAFTASITSLTSGTLYYVRAYAINSVGTSYGGEVTFRATETLTSTHTVDTYVQETPTVALNSPADAGSTSDTTPDLSFTGTDPNGDDVRYNIQISSSSAFGGTVSYPDSNRNEDTAVYTASSRVGQSFTATGGKLYSASLMLSKFGSPTGTAQFSVYAHTGTYGSTGTGTGTALASSGTIDLSTLNGTPTTTTLYFTGPNQITLEDGTYYVIVAEYSGGDMENYLLVGRDSSSPTHDGIMVRYSSSWGVISGNDAIFYVVTLPTVVDAISGTDSGFSGTPDNTDPFASGQQVTYTVQSALAADTYYWRVRGIDPSGSNTYGAWSSTRSFTVSDSSETKTHTIDALVFSQNTATHTADTLVKTQNTATHTVDTLVATRDTSTHTVDTLVNATSTATHTVDTLAKEELTATHTVDAFVTAQETDTHTVDTYVQEDGCFLVQENGDYLLAENQDRILLESCPADALEITHTIDAVAFNRSTDTHTTDTLVLAQNTATHTVDALSYTQDTATHTVDTLAYTTATSTHTIDALVLARNTDTHTVDTLVYTRDTSTHTADTLVFDSHTDTHTVDTAVYAQGTSTHTVDTYVQEDGCFLVQENGDYLLAENQDRILLETCPAGTYTSAHTVDTLVLNTATDTHTVDTLVKAEVTATHSVDTLVLEQDTVAHTVDALVRTDNTDTHTVDTLAYSRETDDHTVDTLVKTQATDTHTVDALVLAQATDTHTVDTLALARTEASHTVDTLTLAQNTATHTVDTYVAEQGVEVSTHSIDLLVLAEESQTHTIDLVVAEQSTTEHSIDTYVSEAVSTGNIKRWNGTAWEVKQLKRWNGSTWVAQPIKRWNGSTWETITY
jgi:hypothetical protein